MAAHPRHDGGRAARLQGPRQPVAAHPADVLSVHEGQDWLYVLDGRLRLVLGEQDLTIEPGDAVEFTTWTPHWFGALDGAVELILIVGPQGERLHLEP